LGRKKTRTSNFSKQISNLSDTSANQNWFNNIYDEHLELKKKLAAKREQQAKIREAEEKKRIEKQKKIKYK